MVVGKAHGHHVGNALHSVAYLKKGTMIRSSCIFRASCFVWENFLLLSVESRKPRRMWLASFVSAKSRKSLCISSLVDFRMSVLCALDAMVFTRSLAAIM